MVCILLTGEEELIATDSVHTYTYDNNGNMLTKSKVITNEDGTQTNELLETYTYDKLNRLISLTNSEGTFLYGYDAENRLTSSEKQYEIVEYYHWNGDYIIRADRYTSGSYDPTWFYIRGNELISKLKDFCIMG